MKKVGTGLLVAALVVLVSTMALATAMWMKTFNNTYKPGAGTALKSAKCGVCHVTPKGGALNPYGTMLKGKKVDAASLKAIEKKDADKDGKSNIAEIKAGSLPGDAKSKCK